MSLCMLPSCYKQTVTVYDTPQLTLQRLPLPKKVHNTTQDSSTSQLTQYCYCQVDYRNNNVAMFQELFTLLRLRIQDQVCFMYKKLHTCTEIF